MNQKYLLGFSIDNQKKENLIYFEATPENIVSFICKYQSCRKLAVCTIDGKPFLTVNPAGKLTIPDRNYLTDQLLPILLPIQAGDAPIPPMNVVSQEAAQAETCPKPDWNYLYWDGYSNQKYQTIMNGSGLLDWEQDGVTHKIELRVRPYMSRSNLAIEMLCWDKGEPEPWPSLTVNLEGRREKNCAFVDVSLKDGLMQWLNKQGLAKPTGCMVQNGPYFYSEYRFSSKRLKELDADGYRVYAEAQRGRSSQSKGGEER